jgi:hypothetical protein
MSAKTVSVGWQEVSCLRGSRSFYLALVAFLPATPKYNFRTSAARRRPVAVALRTDRKQRLLSSHDSIVSRARPMRHPENQFSGVANPGHEQQDHRSAHNFPSRVSREPTIILLATRVATCYPRSVNRNIFYIIGVIVVVVIVLKVLHVF